MMGGVDMSIRAGKSFVLLATSLSPNVQSRAGASLPVGRPGVFEAAATCGR